MHVIEPRIPIGCRVLFLYNSYALTGTVRLIGKESYGIKCDSDHFTTDKLMVPRDHELVFAPIKNCIKDAETLPIRYENGKVNESYRFANILDAKQILPKKTIYPCLSSGNFEGLIQFIPEKHIFRLDNEELYFYSFQERELVTLKNLIDLRKRKVPNWKYQRGFNFNPEMKDFVTEDNILEVYEIPGFHQKRFLLDEGGLNEIIKRKLYDIVFSKTENDRRLIQFHNVKKDTIEEELPNEIFYDENLFLKRDNQN